LPDAAYRRCRADPSAHVMHSGMGDRHQLGPTIASIQESPVPPGPSELLAKPVVHVDTISGR